jgi:benzoyl-CoA reductase/2-hydroxyglutaryl-CoA dehydratase subunit BcrC/BadD/HgdB
MMLQYFKDLESGIAEKLKQNPDIPNARKKYALEVARLGRRLYSGENSVAWCGITAPFDLLSAMGVTSCFVEFIGAMLATTGTIGTFLDHAEQSGYASDICGYHRSVLGSAKQGLMPVPDFLIATSCPCTGGLAVMENLAELFKKELFVLHIPQDESEKSVKYLANQIERMAEFVSSHTGRPLDKEALGRAIENTNRARELMKEVFGLASHIPSPTNGHDLSNFGIVMALLLGTEAAVEISEAYRDEFAARNREMKPGMPGEKHRLMWIQNRIQFKNPLDRLLREQYSANIVVDELNSITWEPVDPDDPYTGLARRAISIPFNGTINRRVSHLQKLALTYKIDGAINPCHRGCRQGAGARGLISEGLREIGIPVLNLEVDVVDPRDFAEGQLATRVEAFIEMLGSRT